MTELIFAKPLFEDFSEVEMQDLLSFSETIKYDIGEYLFHEGDESNSIYIIFSGNVEISAINKNNENVSFAVIGNGTVIGEIAFFDGRQRTASAKAVEKLETIIFSHENFSKLENNKPMLAIKVLKEFGRITAERLRLADAILIDLFE